MLHHNHTPIAGTPRSPGKRALHRICSAGRIMPVLLVLLLIQIPNLAAAQQFRKAVFPRHSTGIFLWDRHLVDASSYPPTTIPNEIAKYNSAHGYSGSNAVSMYCDVNNMTPEPMNNWEDWANVFE